MPNVPLHNRLNLALDAATPPAVIVPITEPLSPPLLDEVMTSPGADVAELRVDLLQPGDGETAGLEDQIKKLARLPLLATIRSIEEGGHWFGEADKKLELFDDVRHWVDGIDIELAFGEFEEAVARADGKVVVASSHHLSERVPVTFEQLEYRFYRAMRAGADYFKIAAMTNNEAALSHVLRFMEFNRGDPIIAVTMGELGEQGRRELIKLGSCATFAYVGDTPLVAGQISLAEARLLLPR